MIVVRTEHQQLLPPPGVDPVAQAGYQKPLVKETVVQVASAGGTVNLRFDATNGKPEGPAVYAVVVLPFRPVGQGVVPAPVVYDSPWAHQVKSSHFACFKIIFTFEASLDFFLI